MKITEANMKMLGNQIKIYILRGEISSDPDKDVTLSVDIQDNPIPLSDNDVIVVRTEPHTLAKLKEVAQEYGLEVTDRGVLIEYFIEDKSALIL